MPTPVIPISKAERLLDLVIALLNSRYFRSAAWIRDHVAGYQDPTRRGGDGAADQAFARMFERDKQELRDLGIPIETDAAGEGYRIRPSEFALPPLSFTPAESAALAVASRLWETTVLADAGSAALRKLRDADGAATDAPGGAAPDEVASARTDAQRRTETPHTDLPTSDDLTTPPLQARLRTSEPAFADLYAAIRSRRAVRFDYRGVADTKRESRSVQPWGMVNHRGSWYVVGYDTDREAPRTFRLSRISGSVAAVGRAGAVTVPQDIDLQKFVATHADPGSVSAALVKIRVGTAAGLRRGGEVLQAAGPDGYDEVRIPVASLHDTARRVAGHGPDVVVVDPPELRAAVRELLAGAAA